MVRFLPESVVLAIHEDQIRLYGGSYEVRDANALDAALHMPKSQFEGRFLHSTIFHMAATYGFHLCQNHPFIDGNKRTAGMAMFAFLRLNGLEPVVSEARQHMHINVRVIPRSGRNSLNGTWVAFGARLTAPPVTEQQCCAD